MNIFLDKYLAYLSVEKNCSPKTIIDYRLELEKFSEYIITEVRNLKEVSISHTSANTNYYTYLGWIIKIIELGINNKVL